MELQLGGNLSAWSGADCDNVLPGGNIVIDPTGTPCWSTAENAIDYESHVKGGFFTGSSYATALAVGVAALVLLCQDPNMIGTENINKGTCRTYRLRKHSKIWVHRRRPADPYLSALGKRDSLISWEISTLATKNLEKG